jgi:hypothetical protein
MYMGPLNNDKEFEKVSNSIFGVFKLGLYALISIWIVGGILALSLLGGLIYVTIHFLQKVW